MVVENYNKLAVPLAEAREHIRDVLSSTFTGMELRFEPTRRPEQIVFFALWDGFEGYDIPDRREMVRRVIETNLSEKELGQVYSYHALTPAEDRSIKDDF
jgi:hypothetical protein